MGWGLSKLQWRILELASDALEPLHGDAEEGTEHPLLKYAVILTDCYGWPQVAENDQRLRRALIGKERYHAGMAAVSRACIRLEARGLVSIFSGSASRWSGIALTEQGRVLVRMRNSFLARQRHRPPPTVIKRHQTAPQLRDKFSVMQQKPWSGEARADELAGGNAR